MSKSFYRVTPNVTCLLASLALALLTVEQSMTRSVSFFVYERACCEHVEVCATRTCHPRLTQVTCASLEVSSW